MMKRFVLCSIFLMVTSCIQAQGVGYLTIYGGAIKGRDQNHRVFNGGNVVLNAVTTMDDGYIVGATSGTELFWGFRAELEGHFQDHGYGQLIYQDGAGATQTVSMSDSSVRYWSGMGNIYCDLVHPAPFLIPFLGGGIGVGYCGAQVPELLDAVSSLGTFTGDLEDSSKLKNTQWVWQLMGGIHLMRDECRFASITIRWWEVYPDFRFVLNDNWTVHSSAKELSISGVYGMVF